MCENGSKMKVRFKYNAIRKHNLFAKMWQQRVLYIFLLPSLLFVVIFNYRPMVGIIMAFEKYDI